MSRKCNIGHVLSMLSLFSHVHLFVTQRTIATRLLCQWDSPGKNTAVGCYALFRESSNPGIEPVSIMSPALKVGSLPLVPPGKPNIGHQFSSVQFSRSVVSDSLQPHESQHARPPCPSPTPGVHSDSPPSSR